MPIAVRVAGIAICGTVPGRRAAGIVYVICGESAPDDVKASYCKSVGGTIFKETADCCGKESSIVNMRRESNLPFSCSSRSS